MKTLVKEENVLTRCPIMTHMKSNNNENGKSDGLINVKIESFEGDNYLADGTTNYFLYLLTSISQPCKPPH